ncbi:ribonuclease H-like domain-containing protein [Rhizophagus irregularis DAOM 181602=DAOM 197198]|nr:ribonuclease H-like domain-containing protein [Rhizophagus irregularis DAOM 181602=DAOM 197198]
MSLKQFCNGVLGFWDFTSAYASDLSAFSTKIYAICINTASVERLFSSMGFFHTNKRNRLDSEKVLAMSQIKGEFQRQKRLKNIMSANKKLKDTNIAIPVVQEQQDDDQFNVSDNDNDFLNQSSEDLEQDIELPCEWRNLINEWIEMVEDEESEILNQEDEENDEIAPLIGRTMDLNEILQKKHPLINETE